MAQRSPNLNSTGTIGWRARHAILELDGGTNGSAFSRTSRAKRAEVLRTARTVMAAPCGGMGTSSWDIVHDRMQLHESLLTLFGQKPDEAADDLLAFVLAEDRPRVSEALETLAAGVGDVTFEYRVITPDGQRKWLSARGRSEHDTAARIGRALLMHVAHGAEARRRDQLRRRSSRRGNVAGGIATTQQRRGDSRQQNARAPAPRARAPGPGLLDAIIALAAARRRLVRRFMQFTPQRGAQRRLPCAAWSAGDQAGRAPPRAHRDSRDQAETPPRRADERNAPVILTRHQ